METRPLGPADHAAIEGLHDTAGLDYRMPDLNSPLFVLKHGAYENGRLVGAAGLRIQAEAYLWLDPQAPVELRYEVVLALSRSLAEAAWRVGLDCVVAWLPPGLPQKFKNLLVKLGWSPDRDGWQSWTKEIR